MEEAYIPKSLNRICNPKKRKKLRICWLWRACLFLADQMIRMNATSGAAPINQQFEVFFLRILDNQRVTSLDIVN